jgi:HK97 family phage prohead protease
MSKIEYRSSPYPLSVASQKRGAGPSAGNVIQGYAAVFNSLSAEMGAGGRSVREVIRPGAFGKVLAGNPDVRGLIDHNSSAILSRTRNGSLTLAEDSHGLRFEMRLIDTQLCRDLLACVKAGLLNQCSFGFTVAPGGDSWRSENGCYLREIRAFDSLSDISVVTFPAYPASECEARSSPSNLSAYFQELLDRWRLVKARCNS